MKLNWRRRKGKEKRLSLPVFLPKHQHPNGITLLDSANSNNSSCYNLQFYVYVGVVKWRSDKDNNYEFLIKGLESMEFNSFLGYFYWCDTSINVGRDVETPKIDFN